MYEARLGRMALELSQGEREQVRCRSDLFCKVSSTHAQTENKASGTALWVRGFATKPDDLVQFLESMR